MNDFYEAEIYSLNREIQRLNTELENEKSKNLSRSKDPFNNPTEYDDFSGDYSEILPQLDAPDFVMPINPDPLEKRKLKRFYAVGGWCVLCQFILSNVLMCILVPVIEGILKSKTGVSDYNTVISYMEGSSIFAGLNMLIYMFVNILFAFVGLKMTHIPKRLLVRTRDFGFGKAVQYCIIALFIWGISIIASYFVNDIFEHYGHSTNIFDMEGFAVSGTGFAIMIIYQCVIAPITEEIFFRGMLLRVFSRAGQRFAVFASAFFFGLSHHNIPQFILAFLIGIFLAHITLCHSSVIPAIIVHIFVNSISNIMDITGGFSDSSLVSTMSVVTAFGIIAIYKFRDNNKIPSITPQQSRRGMAVAKSSVLFMSAIIIQVIYTGYLIYRNTI